MRDLNGNYIVPSSDKPFGIYGGSGNLIWQFKTLEAAKAWLALCLKSVTELGRAAAARYTIRKINFERECAYGYTVNADGSQREYPIAKLREVEASIVKARRAARRKGKGVV